jgi:leucyl-tRNA synthetase
MSKSKGNTVDPQNLIERYGADTVRLFTMFAAPPDQSLEWSDSGVEGASRFLKRLWDLAYKRKASFNPDSRPGMAGAGSGEPGNRKWDGASARQLERRRHIHTLLKKANDDFSRQQFNTVVSAAMQILNNLQVAFPAGGAVAEPDGVENDTEAQLQYEGLSILLRMLYPITPHIAHNLWHELGYGEREGIDILDAKWPEVDASALVQHTVTLVIQVNGKVRGRIDAPADAGREILENLVINEANVRKHLQDRPVKKFIVVPGKLVNVVV